MKAVNNPRERGPNRINVLSLEKSRKAAIEEIAMAGIPSKYEYLAASSRLQPINNATEIVIPDLDTPGIIANAWPSPIRKESIKLWLDNVVKFLFEWSAININIAIKIEIRPIEKFDLKNELVKFGTNSLIKEPNNIIDMVPTDIEINIFRKEKLLQLECLNNLETLISL